MPKQTLRNCLLTPSVEALPKTGSSLLSCFTPAESPKSAPPAQERLSASGEALELCGETALQSWFDPLDLSLDQESNTLTVRFPHAFFALRFSSLFQGIFEKKARALWGRNLTIVYGASKTPPSPPILFVPPAAEACAPGVHPAVGNPTPFGEEWTLRS